MAMYACVMKHKRAPDIDRVRKWPQFYWNLTGRVCACLPTAAAALVSLNALTVPVAVIATAAGIAYVLLTTCATRANRSRLIHPTRQSDSWCPGW